MTATDEAIPGSVRPTTGPSTAAELPAWPLVLLLAPYLVWWALGVLDMILVPIAFVMVLYLMRARGVRVPRGFAIWLVFLLWAAMSVLQLTGGVNPMIGFGYRYLVYAGATVVFVYAYNARRYLTLRNIAGLLTIVWLSTVVGGYLGVFFPGYLLRTPTSFLLRQMVSLDLMSSTIANNDLVQHMVVRRFTQGNENSFFQFSPRPSAPFRFTNNWGNVYSILLPIVVAYMAEVRRTRRFWLLAIALPVSAVPALLTLNRGMLLGIGLAVAYVTARKIAAGQTRFLLVALVGVIVGVVLYSALGIQQKNETRFFSEGTNQTRASLYLQAIDSVGERPFFGYGAPQQGTDPDAPNVGTQGQVWLVLVSHGPVALATFTGWLLLAVWQSRRRRDAIALACHTSLLVGVIELVYYGVVPYGLPLMMLAAAAALRPMGAVVDQETSAPPESEPAEVVETDGPQRKALDSNPAAVSR